MRIRSRFIILLVIISVPGITQTGTDYRRNMASSQNVNSGEGSLIIHQDNRLDILVNRFEEVQKNRKGMPGYRIQIYFGSGRTARTDAYEAKANFLTKFSDFPAYVLYQSPFYKVRVGDFRSKREAHDLLIKVQRTFPNAYITPIETINLPPLE